jgi:hypothetical protein
MKRVSTIFLCIAILATAIPVYAEEQNVINQITNWFKGALPASWGLPSERIKITDTEIQFYVSISNENWRIDMTERDTGALVQSRSGFSYGTASFNRPAKQGYYRLTVYCFYTSRSVCTGENFEDIYIPAKSSAYISPMVTPIVTPIYGTPTPSPTSQTGGEIKFIPDVFIHLWNAFFGWLKGIF